MNIIKKIISLIVKVFNKKEILTLEAPEQVIKENRKTDFIDSLKVTTAKKIKKKKVETLICEGDGLGIQKKISW